MLASSVVVTSEYAICQHMGKNYSAILVTLRAMANFNDENKIASLPARLSFALGSSQQRRIK